jgi:hypothetical protein
MPQQLIYTSAPRGIVAGRSGHCTVARSALMREALMLQLEKFCYYQHLSLSGGKERPIFSCRIVDIRGTRFHVLSRIQDAGLDFTGRTNFIAHHLVFTPEEIRQYPTPPVILQEWPGWIKSWTKEPQLLENEDWAALTVLAGKTNVPAQTWQRVTADAVNSYGLLEARAGASFRVDDLADETVLDLVAESLELLEVRDPRRDFRTAAWNYTFTTSMQEQDNPADFRWRCLHSDNPTANRLATPDCRALSAVRATKWAGEETAFSRTGRQAPQLVAEPQDTRSTEGEPVRFTAKAEGIPAPTYQWFSVDRAGNGTVLPGETKPGLIVSNPVMGVSRYVVNATNSAGNVHSRVATLSVETKLKLAAARTGIGTPIASKAVIHQKTEEEIERQRQRIEAEKAQEFFERRQWRNVILLAFLAIVLIAGVGIFAWHQRFLKKLSKTNQATLQSADISTPTSSGTSSNAAANINKPPENHSDQGALNNRPGLTPYPLPPGWKSMLIGNVSYSYVDYTSNTPPKFQLVAAADGFSTNGDNILFVCKTNAPTEFEASIYTEPNDLQLAANSFRGLMIRESRETNSPFLFVGISSQTISSYRREANGKFETKEFQLQKSANGPHAIIKLDQTNGGQVVPSFSYDQQTWGYFQSYEFPTNAQLLVGFALCSGNSSNHAIAHYVELTP